MARAFIPNPDNLPIINHKSEVKTENNASNLEWCDANYNCHYGTAIDRKAKKLSKWVIKLSKDNEILHFYSSTKQAAKETGLFATSIAACCRGKHEHTGGYKWVYAS